MFVFSDITIILHILCQGGACLPIGREFGRPVCRQADTLDSKSGAAIFHYLYLCMYDIMITVYAIKSTIKNYIYVGMTDNLERRLKEHNSGKQQSTKAYIPYELIYTEVCNDRISARIREKYWKSGTGKEKLRML